MIREYRQEDQEEIIKILKEGNIFDLSYIAKAHQENDYIIKVYESGEGVKGFALLTLHNKGMKSWILELFVALDARKQGIGTALYEEAVEYLKEIGAKTVCGKCVVNVEGNELFFKEKGYKKWFKIHNMLYKGDRQEQIPLQFVPYEDQYYEKYGALLVQGFYPLREANDIKPYECWKPSEENRKAVLEDEGSIYIATDEKNEIIATVMIKDGVIDDLVVDKHYQGKGIGKQTTQFAINKALEEGMEKISLDVVRWNEPAIALYQSLGFEIVQSVQFYRLSIRK